MERSARDVKAGAARDGVGVAGGLDQLEAHAVGIERHDHMGRTRQLKACLGQ